MTSNLESGRGAVPLQAVRSRMLNAAERTRAAGRSALTVATITPAEALRRTAADLDTLLESLSVAQWRRPALRDLDVQGLVGHLTGVEEHVQRCLADGGDTDIADVDHVAATDAAASAQAGRSPAATRTQWRAAVDHTLDIVAGMTDVATRQVAVHGMQLSVASLLVVRSFELWTHANDIRRATGLPASTPDAATLQLMTELAARMVPMGVRRTTGSDLRRPVRLVLTGNGGGVWDLGADSTRVVATRIVADAADFCRVVSNRLQPDALEIDVWGDERLVDEILVGACSLALD